MPRVFLLLATLTVTWLAPIRAWADSDWDYLGGTMSPEDCRSLAASSGYQYWAFGGYVDGYYYWNACFGQGHAVSTPQSDCRASGGDAQHATGDWYRVNVPSADLSSNQVRQDRDLCMDDIENDISGVLCYSDCSENRKMHCLDLRARGHDIMTERLLARSCVRGVGGPYKEAEDTANSF